MPEAVKLLGRYDVWDHASNEVLPFQYGMRNIPDTFPGSNLWNNLLKSDEWVIDILNKGATILEYERKQNVINVKGMSFETTFKGLRAIVTNKPFSNSKVFDSVYDESKHDIMIIFGCKPGSFKYSLYSTKDTVDCSEIAKLFGGGGHKGAAGFYSDILLF